MISINGSFFISGLRSIGSELQTKIKNLSSFLSKLNGVTNAGAHASETPILFRNRDRSTNSPATFPHPQNSVPAEQTEQGSGKVHNLTGKRQAPQPPQGLVTTLEPLLKEFQLQPDIAVARKTLAPHARRRQAPPVPPSAKKRQAPQPPASALTAKPDLAIKADRQSVDGTAYYARHNITADPSPKIRQIPMPPLSPALTAELEPMTREAGLRIGNGSAGIIPTKVRRSLPPSLQLPQPERMAENNKRSTDKAIVSPEQQPLVLSPAQEALADKLRMALNDFHLDPEAAKAKWIPAPK